MLVAKTKPGTISSAKKPRIAYFTINDPLDKRSWSGITYYMGQSIAKNIGHVEFLGPVRIPYLLDKTLRAIQKLTRFFSNTEYLPKYGYIKNRYAAWQLNRKLKKGNFDFVFGPASAPELGCLNTSLPVVYFGDATFKLYSRMYHKEFAGAGRRSLRNGNILEQKALSKSRLRIFSSAWAAESAIKDYAVPPQQIEIIQLGANIERAPEYAKIFEKLQNQELTLLFLSVDWERKGGAIAFQTLKMLHARGLAAQLIICGCEPPPLFADPHLVVIPFLDKNNNADTQKLTELLLKSHFLLLPTRADCTPLVNCEANAFGIPAITTDVGGISDTVKDGINGYCLPLEGTGIDYAGLIAEIYEDKERYRKLIQSSRKQFDEELNWDHFSIALKAALEKHAIYHF